jgi:hypothetical protein
MFVVFRKSCPESGGRGQNKDKNFITLNPAQEITGPWTVQFDPQWFYPTDGLSGDPAKGLMTFDKLEDWTQRSEPAVKHFSGTAVYRKSFDFAPDVRAQESGVGKTNTDLRSLTTDLSARLYLDLGVVKESARVKLNGKDLGVVWCHPWRVEISKAVKPGENQLEIEVVNLWPNRLIGDSGLPAPQRRTRTNMPLNAKGKFLPSGLLGPVIVMKNQ